MTEEHYQSHFQVLRDRYDLLLENHQFDQLNVFSGSTKQRFRDDMPYPFFVNIQFKAIVPLINTPDSWVVWRVGSPPLLLIYQPDDYWHVVPKIEADYWTEYFSIVFLKNKKEAQQYFKATDQSAFLGEINENIIDWALGERNPHLLIAELDWRRSTKTNYEIACIKTANEISVRGHLAARDSFLEGASELEISLKFQQACHQCEEELAYPCIVGINRNASILHYWGRHNKRLAPEDRFSMLIDAAAGFRGYASDITRTYSAKNGMFAHMIMRLDEIQQQLVSEHQVGKRYFDLSMMMLFKVAELLNDIGILKADVALAVEDDIIRFFLPHSLGHFVGLQVHDVGSCQKNIFGDMYKIHKKYPLFRMLREIQPDQVVTVEPGIYFIDQLLRELKQSKYRDAIDWPLVDELVPYGGIRIEDNIVTTDYGPINLTREAFAEVSPRF